jgi:hypothetical protein
MCRPVNVIGPVLVKFTSNVTVPPVNSPAPSRVTFAVTHPTAAVSTPVTGGTSLAGLMNVLK